MVWPWTLTFWPKNVIRSSVSQDAPVTKVWRKSVNRYWRYRGNIKLLRESRTHGRTTRKHIASAGAYRRRRLKKQNNMKAIKLKTLNITKQTTYTHLHQPSWKYNNSMLPCKSSVVGMPPPSSSLGVGCVIARWGASASTEADWSTKAGGGGANAGGPGLSGDVASYNVQLNELISTYSQNDLQSSNISATSVWQPICGFRFFEEFRKLTNVNSQKMTFYQSKGTANNCEQKWQHYTLWITNTPTQPFCNNFGKYRHILIIFTFLHYDMFYRRSQIKSVTSPQLCCYITLQNWNVEEYNCSFTLARII